MFASSDRPSSLLLRALVVVQVFLLVATLFAPISVSAADESPDPSASAPATTEPSATPDPTVAPDPTPEPPAATPDPTPEPPAATPDPTVEPPATTPEPSTDPTPEPSTAPSSGPSTPAGSPTIASDLEDYPPGGLVTLSGTGWQSGESVHIFVNDDWGSSWSRNVDVVADTSGAIVDQFNLPNWFVAQYSVIADGSVSGRARTSFTDSNPGNITVLPSTTATVVPGAQAVFGNVSIASGGNANICNVTLGAGGTGVTGLPTGATPVFGTNPVPVSNTTATTTLRVNTTATGPSTTPVGTYTFKIVQVSSSGTCNGSGANPSNVVTLIVAKDPSTTTVTCPATAPWTGSPVTPCTAVATGSSGLNQSLTVTYSNNTNLGLATANATFAGDATHNGSSGSASFTIVKASSTTMVTCPPSVTYTGGTLTPCTATVTGAGGLNLSAAVTYTNNTAVGTATASASFAGDATHNGSNGSATFTIAKASSTTTVTCPAGPYTYTGSAQTPCSATVTGVGGLNESLTVSYTSNTDAGTATASAAFAGDASHESSTDSKTFTIGKATSATTVTCPAGPYTYTGAPQTPCSVSVTGAGGLNLTPVPSYGNNTNAGTATASYTFTGDANHTGSSDSKTFTIDKAASVTTVTCPAGPYTYTGSAQTPCSVTVTGAGGLNLTPTPSYTDNTHVGTATASYTFVGDANHLGSNDDDTFTIDKADAECAVTGYSVTYDGNANTATGTCTGVQDEVLAGLDLSGTTHTDAGTYTDTWTFTDATGNYNDQGDSVTDSIAKAASTVTVTCPESVTYDGSAQEPCTASVTGAGGLNDPLTVVYTNNTNAGTASASASFDGDDNHEADSDSTTFVIEKAESTTVLTCPSDVTYTGSALTPCSATVTGDGGLNESVSVDYANNTNAGTASASATFSGDDNHVGSADATTFVIKKAASVVAITCPTSVTYTSFAQEPCTASATGVGGLNEALTVTYTDNVDAGTAHANASFDGDANHIPSSNTKSFEIDPASLTVEFAVEGKTYDATTDATITDCSVSVVLDDDVVTCDFDAATASFEFANAGTHPVSGMGFALAGADAHNYVISSIEDTNATIAKADPTISITPYDVTYDGDEHTATGSAKGVLDEPLAGLDLSGTAHTNAGNFTDTWTFTDVTGNYKDATGTVVDNIDKADAVITVTPYDVTYDGDEHTATGTAVGVNDEDLAGLDLSGTAHTNAGTYPDSWTFTDVTGNYNDDSGTVTDQIDKANATIEVTAYDVVYNGSPHTATGTATGVDGEELEGLDLSQTTHTDAGVYDDDPWTFTDTTGNYSDTSGTVDDNIDQAPSATTVNCPADVTYDGSAQTPCSASATGAGGLNQSLTVGYANNTNAGTASASATFAGDANHTGSSGGTTFEIKKAESTTAVTCEVGPHTYTGAAQEPCSATVTGAGGLSLTPTPDYANNTDAGTATASYTYTGDANHNASDDSEDFTIDQASSTTTVTCAVGPHTYTGSAHEPCSASVTGAGGLNLTPTPGYSNNTNAGTATASYAYAGDSNHTGSTGNKTFTIDKAGSTTTVTCSAGPHVYTGSPLTPCTASVTGAGSLYQAVSVVHSSNTNAGTAGADATFDGDANHESSTDSESFTIDKAGSTTTVTCTAGPFMYNGSAYTPCSASVTGAGGLSQLLTPSYSNNTNAGTAGASASYAGDANHDGSNSSTTFAIGKAGSSTSVTCPASVPFTGSALAPCSALATGVGGLSQNVAVDYTNNTNAGTAGASASFAGDTNHNSSSGTSSFTITKASSTTSISCPASVVYTGSALMPCSVSVTGAGGLNQSPTATYANNMFVGTATATYTYSGDANHYGSNATKNFLVTTAFRIIGFDSPVDMTLATDSTPYWNSVKGGQTVPLKFRVYNLNGTEVTSIAGLSAWASSVACISGDLDTTLLPTELASNVGLMRTGDRFHFNWAVPKTASKCYQVYIRTADGSTVMVASMAGTPELEAFFKSK